MYLSFSSAATYLILSLSLSLSLFEIDACNIRGINL